MLTGALGAAFFPGRAHALLGLLVWVPLLWALRSARPARAAGLAMLAQFVMGFGHTPWVYEAAREFGELSGATAAVGFLLHQAWLAIPALLSAALAAWLTPRWSLRIGAFAAGQAVAGWLFPTPFSFVFAYAWLDHPAVVQVASVGGREALTVGWIMAGGAVATLLVAAATRRRPALWSVLCLLGVAATVAWGQQRLDHWEAVQASAERFPVGVVQGNLGARQRGIEDQKPRLLAEQQRVSAELSAQGARLLVWGENAYPFPERFPHGATRGPGFIDRQRVHRGFSVPVIVGTVRRSGEGEALRRWNSALLVAELGEVLDSYDKIHLLPFSEYFPGVPEAWARKLAPGAVAFERGTEVAVFEVEGVRWAPVICREDLLASVSREVVRAGADVLVVLSNDAWFGATSAPRQHETLARLRAVEVGRPMIRVSNAGPSSWIDPTGQVHQRTAVTVPDRDGEVPAVGFLAQIPLVDRAHRTLSSRGPWLEVGCLLLLLLGVGGRLRRRATPR